MPACSDARAVAAFTTTPRTPRKPCRRICTGGPKPAEIVVEGRSRTGSGFGRLARDAGIAVIVREGAGLIRLDDTILALTDGRTATERMVSDGSPTVLFDLALDYAAATRMAIARCRPS